MWLSMEVNFEVTLLIIPDFQLKIFYLFLSIMNITTLIKRNFKNQHKTTWRYQFIPTTMAIFKRQVSVAGDTGKSEPSQIAGGNRKWCSYCGKYWQFLKRLNIDLA